MKSIKKYLIIFAVITSTALFNKVHAQPPCPNPCCGVDAQGDCIDCDPAVDCVPLDGGLILILAGALGLGIKKIRSKKD
jgi:hypothetical protein